MVAPRKNTITGSEGNDTINYKTLASSTLNTAGGNDIVTIDTLTSSTILLGAGNDVLNITNFGSGISTIDGGPGSDTIAFQSLAENKLILSYMGKSTWFVGLDGKIDSGFIISNIEKLNFSQGIVGSLASGKNDTDPGRARFAGTSAAETFWLPISPSFSKDEPGTIASIYAYAGDDTIIVPSAGGGVPTGSFVNGGIGNDTLKFLTLPSACLFKPAKTGWEVLQPNRDVLIDLVSVENVIFADGTTVVFGASGIELTGGGAALQVEGTSGDDTIHGSAMEDSFWTTSGADFYDLSQGGADTLYLDPSAYAAGTTNTLTIKGFSNIDTLRFSDGSLVKTGALANVSDNSSFANGYRAGTLSVDWLLSSSLHVTTIITFQAS